MIDVVGYEGLYGVTSCGKVYSYKRKKFLKPWECCGYLYVALYKNNETRKFRVHRLVAEAYLENPDNLPEVHHKDHNRTNNCLGNLEWIAKADNVREATSKAIYQFNLAGNLIRVWPSISEASRETCIDGSSISKCARGKYKTAGGFIWRYEEASEQ